MPYPPYPSPNNYKVVQFRRGSTVDNEALLGAQGEITVDLDKGTAVVHDGVMTGGYPLRRADAEFARSSSILFRMGVAQEGVPFLGLSTQSNAPAPGLVTTSSGVIAVVATFSPSMNQQVQGSFTVPYNWPTTPMNCMIQWRTNDVLTPVNWTLEVGGLVVGTDVNDFTFNPVDYFPEQLPSMSNVFLTSQYIIQDGDLAGIVPTSELYFRFGRGTDSSTYPADVFSIRFDVDRYGP